MSDNLSVLEAQIAARKIKCSDFVSEKWFLFGETQKALDGSSYSPALGESRPVLPARGGID